MTIQKNGQQTKFWSDLVIINTLGASIVLNIVLWAWTALKAKTDMTEVPLHYFSNFGIDYWGEPGKLYVLPTIGLLLLVINFVLIFFSYRWEKLAARFLSVSILLVQVILLVASILITSIPL